MQVIFGMEWHDWTFGLSNRIKLFVLLKRLRQQPWLLSDRSSSAGVAVQALSVFSADGD